MKKTLSLIMALALVFGLVLIAAPAAEAAGCDHTSHEGWTAWDGTLAEWEDGSTRKGLKAGKYYLTADVTVETIVMIERHAEVTLCLNGHTVTSTSTASGAIFDLMTGNADKGNTVMNICDCSAEKTGKIERTALPDAGRYGAVLFCRDYCELNIYGGTLKVSVANADAKASAIYGNGVTNIAGDVKVETVDGTGFYINKGILNVTDLAGDITVALADTGTLNTELTKTEAAGITTIKAPAQGSTPVKPNPGTGDANVALMVAGLLIGLCGVAAVAILPKKQSI